MSMRNSATVCSRPFCFGYDIIGTTDTTVLLGIGVARSVATVWPAEFPIGNNPAYITIDATTVGANGCWPIAIPSGASGYFVLLLSDSTGANSPAAIIQTALLDSLPSGYDNYTAVGLVTIDSSGDIVPGWSGGKFEDRKLVFQDPQQILNAGAATTETALNLSTLADSIPNYPFVKSVDLAYSFTPNSAANIAYIAPANVTPTSRWPYQIKTNGTAEVQGVLTTVGVGPSTVASVADTLTSGAALQYKVTSASDSLSLWVVGFELSLDLIAPFNS